jgi:uncharacterized protein (TIGR00251 family)
VASDSQSYYRWKGDTLTLFCHLQPQASRSEFAGTLCTDQYGERLKIRIAAPPLEGKANAQLIAFLAREFGVAKRAVRIVSGDAGRQKSVAIERPTLFPAALSIAPPPATL